MSKFRHYKNYDLFLETTADNNYYVLIYKNSSQLDFTEYQKDSELAYKSAMNIVDSWENLE